MKPKITVLMVDDEEQFRKTTKKILEKKGFETLLADSGRQAIDMLSKQPDVVILGCTHFPLLSKAIGAYFRGARLIHSGEAIVEYLQKEKLVKENQQFEKTHLRLFASESGHRLKEVAKSWIGKESLWYS